MKNLFDYATKELSQDAFLRWLFENYDCENKSVKNAFRKVFDSFTDDRFKGKEITDLVTVAQWKNIDISIWFQIDGEEHLIVIEDKTGSGIHDDQLARYEKEIIKHNDFWNKEENRNKYKPERYVEKRENIFKIFYKTNIIDSWEKDCVEKNKWKACDIYFIYNLFSNLETDNEVLEYYIEHIKSIYTAAKRTLPPSEWNLISWHAFFNDYHLPDCISQNQEVNCYQKKYYYIKFFVKGHEKNMPCFEIRSRNFKIDKDSGKCSTIARAVLYNLSQLASAEDIEKWQDQLKKYGFNLNYRGNISKHKQIGWIMLKDIENTESALINALDHLSELLSLIF